MPNLPHDNLSLSPTSGVFSESPRMSTVAQDARMRIEHIFQKHACPFVKLKTEEIGRGMCFLLEIWCMDVYVVQQDFCCSHGA